MNQKTQRRRLERRKARVRKKVQGTPQRPRLTVFRSNTHIYAQVVDDVAGLTLAAASSKDVSLRETVKSGSSAAAAQAVGKLLAERARAANVTNVVFDRNGRLYHGRVKALADASREGGLAF